MIGLASVGYDGLTILISRNISLYNNLGDMAMHHSCSGNILLSLMHVRCAASASASAFSLLLAHLQ